MCPRIYRLKWQSYGCEPNTKLFFAADDADAERQAKHWHQQQIKSRLALPIANVEVRECTPGRLDDDDSESTPLWGDRIIKIYPVRDANLFLDYASIN